MKKKKVIQKERMVHDAGEELEELERYIEELSTFLPLPFCIVNPSGVILNINQTFTDLTGYNNLEIIGEKMNHLFDKKKEAGDLERRILKEGLVKNQEMTLITKSKVPVIVNVSGSVRKDREGNFIGYFLAFSDISELKKLQKELEQKVEERTRQYKEKMEELEKFNKLAVGRELKMVELKQEIEKLKKGAS